MRDDTLELELPGPKQGLENFSVPGFGQIVKDVGRRHWVTPVPSAANASVGATSSGKTTPGLQDLQIVIIISPVVGLLFIERP